MTPNKNIEEQVDNFIKENSQSGMFDVLNVMRDGDKRLKDFIKSLLDQQRQEIIEILESDELDYVEHGKFIDRDLAISKIKEME